MLYKGSAIPASTSNLFQFPDKAASNSHNTFGLYQSSLCTKTMYDPARDIFTAADEAQIDTQDQNESPGNKRKRSGSPMGSDPLPSQSGGPSDERKTGTTLENERPEKRIKSIVDAVSEVAAPVPTTAANLAKLPRVKKAPSARLHDAPRRPGGASPPRKRSRSPARRSPEDYRRERRSPTRRRSPSPAPIRRSPTPPARSPPRQRKRPGGSARINAADTEAVRRRQVEREEDMNNQAQAAAVARGVHDVVKQHYNAVPQRGREWRKTDSKIKGLRSLNNWIKSAIIQRFSPEENFTPGAREGGAHGQGRDERGGLLVLDIGCGKGGDLQKWQSAPQRIELYVGLDPADVSIEQARERYQQMQRGGRPGRDRYPKRVFHAEFAVKDCFGDWIGDIPIVQEVGIDGSVGPTQNGMSHRWGGGGFDIVTMMFCMHYAFESEAKARGMLRNVAGALKKGGRFIGAIPNSDILTAKINEHNAKTGAPVVEHIAPDEDDDDDDWDPEKTLDAPKDAPPPTTENEEGPKEDNPNPLEWGNGIYRVKFPGRVPADGIFRPAFGWKYFFFLEEAVEEIPEYVVPWEAFRALALEYDLELSYRRPFNDVWEVEKNDPILGPLSERMGVRERDAGRLLVSDEEFEAACEFYWCTFC